MEHYKDYQEVGGPLVHTPHKPAEEDLFIYPYDACVRLTYRWDIIYSKQYACSSRDKIECEGNPAEAVRVVNALRKRPLKKLLMRLPYAETAVYPIKDASH